MSAALTPRVLVLAVCDAVLSSEIEEDVFTLEGVRQGFRAESFPCVRALEVYLLLSYHHGGRFDGQVKMIHEREDDVIRYGKFTAAFESGSALCRLVVELDDCVFPEPGVFSVTVEFWTPTGDVLKGEQPFHVWPIEE